MNIEELFSGVGLVIDDKVNVTNGEDRITKIVVGAQLLIANVTNV